MGVIIEKEFTMKDATNLTELAQFFPTNPAPKQPQTVTLVAARFWKPGESYHQALARQRAHQVDLAKRVAQKGL
jgi:hypothetical protein